VDAFLSNCRSLIFDRRPAFPDPAREVFVVSRDRQILDYLPASLGACRFVSHYSDITDFATNKARAADLLRIYRDRAKLIVTTLLHCALPAIAMRIPVVVFWPPGDGPEHQSDRERFIFLAGRACPRVRPDRGGRGGHTRCRRAQTRVDRNCCGGIIYKFCARVEMMSSVVD
jgi:hypothetical protein